MGVRTSGERSRNVTVECCVSAAGKKLPPAFVFARKRMKPDLMTNTTTEMKTFWEVLKNVVFGLITQTFLLIETLHQPSNNIN